jgi:hypothetical protein
VVDGSGLVGRGRVVRSRGRVVNLGGGFVGRGRVVRSRGGFVVDDGSGFVSGSRGRFVCGSRGGFIGGGVGRLVFLVFGVVGLSFVFDVSGVSVGISLVGDDLDTAVGKVHTVFTSGIVVISVFSMRENGTGVTILNSIFVVVHWGEDGIFMVGGGVRGSIRCRCVGGSGGNSQKGGEGDLHEGHDVLVRVDRVRFSLY